MKDVVICPRTFDEGTRKGVSNLFSKYEMLASPIPTIRISKSEENIVEVRFLPLEELALMYSVKYVSEALRINLKFYDFSNLVRISRNPVNWGPGHRGPTVLRAPVKTYNTSNIPVLFTVFTASWKSSLGFPPRITTRTGVE